MIFTVSKGWPSHEDNRLWYPTIQDIRNLIREKGAEFERMDDLVETLREDPHCNVHYECIRDQEVQYVLQFLIKIQKNKLWLGIRLHL